MSNMRKIDLVWNTASNNVANANQRFIVQGLKISTNVVNRLKKYLRVVKCTRQNEAALHVIRGSHNSAVINITKAPLRLGARVRFSGTGTSLNIAFYQCSSKNLGTVPGHGYHLQRQYSSTVPGH